MAIVINGSGTITGISVGGLPDGVVDSGTLATNSVDSAELIDGAVDDSHMAAMAASKLTGALPAISGASLTGITTGKILQVLSTTLTAVTATTTSSTMADLTGLSVDITPSATSSKIYVVLSVAASSDSTGGSAAFGLMRDTTAIGNGVAAGSKTAAGTGISTNATNIIQGVTMSYLDSPSADVATTYKARWAVHGGATLYINRSAEDYDDADRQRCASTITVMEIGA